jgi:WD40 repeat protein
MTDRTAHSDLSGQQFGEYRLSRWLGGGGFGNVYLGEHIRDSAPVAVKVLQARLAQSHELKEFINEARTIRLIHPHIVRLLDFGIGMDDIPFLVMEYAPNGTLRHRHPRGTRVPLAVVNDYVTAIASALNYAHDHHLIHRDVKPENMLIGPEQEIWLSDFGIVAVAHSTHSFTERQGISGTLSYMAPEQIHGKPRPASDQYALGIVAYEWLSGQRPFTGTVVELISQHTATPPPSLRALVPGLPIEVEQVIFTALQKDPSQRFATIQAFADAFQHASQPDDTSTELRTRPIMSSQVTIPVTTERIAPINGSSSTSSPPSPQPQSSEISEGQASHRTHGKHHVSRRTLLAGIAGLTAVAGGAAYLVSHGMASPPGSAQGSISPHPSTPRTTTTPTAIPHANIGRLIYAYHGHTNHVYAIRWSHYDQRLVSASEDGTAQIWNMFNSNDILIYKKHTARVNAVDWSVSGKYIVSGSSDMTAHIWDSRNGSTSFIYKQHTGAIFTVGWSPLSGRVASGGQDKTVRVWNVADGSNTYVWIGHSDIVNQLAWSPDGRRIASCSNDKTVQVWHSTDGSSPVVYREHSASVRAVAWAPNEQFIASAGDDQTVHIWNPTTGKTIYVYRKHSAPVTSVTWSPDSKYIASASEDHTVHVWFAPAGSSLYVYGQMGAVFCVVWSHDGKYIASAGDRIDPTVQVWDA